MSLDRIKHITYAIWCQTVENNIKEEVTIQSDVDYPKRTKSIKAFQTIATYTKDVLEKCNIHFENDEKVPNIPIPSWSFEKANFDITYSDHKRC